MLRTLVIGLGNPILGDDGVGWKVAEAMGPRLAADPPRAQAVEVDYAALGGLSLMERLVGYDRAVIVDAVVTRRPVGTVARYRLDDFPERGGANLTAVHDASLQTALALGRQLGAHLPRDVVVVGIEAERLCDFSEALTPAVAAAVPQAVGAVWDALHSFSEED
jgi:hydrogenase maturation protease